MMPQSCDCKIEDVKRLREHTGAGMTDCKRALEKFDWDWWLAAGYLKYVGCAISVWKSDASGKRYDAREEWAVEQAHQYKRRHYINQIPTDQA